MRLERASPTGPTSKRIACFGVTEEEEQEKEQQVGKEEVAEQDEEQAESRT